MGMTVEARFRRAHVTPRPAARWKVRKAAAPYFFLLPSPEQDRLAYVAPLWNTAIRLDP